MVRVLCLSLGACVLAVTATKALRHLVMVPVDDPLAWECAIAFGVFLVGLAIMPASE